MTAHDPPTAAALEASERRASATQLAFQQETSRWCTRYRWLCYHAEAPYRTTPEQEPGSIPGFPGCVIATGSGPIHVRFLLLAHRDSRTPSDYELNWLIRVGGLVVRPADIPALVNYLRDPDPGTAPFHPSAAPGKYAG